MTDPVHDLVRLIEEDEHVRQGNERDLFYAARDAAVYGEGFLRVRVDRSGRRSMTRLHPETVRLLPEHVAHDIGYLSRELWSAADAVEHLMQMIDPQTWRDTGGDDGQGHYEGDYRAARLAEDVRMWKAAAGLQSRPRERHPSPVEPPVDATAVETAVEDALTGRYGQQVLVHRASDGLLHFPLLGTVLTRCGIQIRDLSPPIGYPTEWAGVWCGICVKAAARDAETQRGNDIGGNRLEES